MMHSAGRGLAFFLLVGLPLLFGEAARGQQEEPAPFEIRLPPEIRSEQVQAKYFLTGQFGAHGESVKAEPERNAYLIGTSVNHQAAETLKVILYAPGCQIVTIVVPSLSESEKATDVSCEDLSYNLQRKSGAAGTSSQPALRGGNHLHGLLGA